MRRALLNVILLTICWLNINNVYAESPKEVKELLIKNKELIYTSAKLFNVQPRLIAAVIYTERTLNVNWMEGKLDLLLAKSGYSSSIGIGQIKIHTALWIEKKLYDSTSKYFLGFTYQKSLPKSKDRDEIVKKLERPEWNLRYIAAYISMFCHRWKNEGFDISKKPEIVATLYSLGPYRVSDSSERKPHSNPQANYFGIEAKEFFYSKELLNDFPL